MPRKGDVLDLEYRNLDLGNLNEGAIQQRLRAEALFKEKSWIVERCGVRYTESYTGGGNDPYHHESIWVFIKPEVEEV